MILDTLLVSVFIFSLICQLYLILIVFSKILLYKKPNLQYFGQKSVSLIICAHNEYENLKELMPLLLGQKEANLELIIVDDRSEDNTQVLLQEYSKQYPKKIRVIHIKDKKNGFHPKKYALTQGIFAASHEIILLSDADCRPVSAYWVAEMWAAFEENIEIVLGFSPYFKQKGVLNAFIQYETFYTAIQYLSLTLAGKPYMGVGRNMAYKKSLFLNQQGLEKHQHITGGDDDLFVNQAAKPKCVSIRIHPKSQVYSIPKKSWGSWYRQKIRHLSVSKHYNISSKIFLGVINASQVLFWLSFLIIIFAHPHKEFMNLFLGCFILRISALWGIFAMINQKIQAQVYSICIPVFDFLYVLYIFIFGVIALSKKHVQWN